jgi:hypothetical protein
MNTTKQRRASMLRPLLSTLDPHAPSEQIARQLREALSHVAATEQKARARKRSATKQSRKRNRKG